MKQRAVTQLACYAIFAFIAIEGKERGREGAGGKHARIPHTIAVKDVRTDVEGREGGTEGRNGRHENFRVIKVARWRFYEVQTVA